MVTVHANVGWRTAMAAMVVGTLPSCVAEAPTCQRRPVRLLVPSWLLSMSQGSGGGVSSRSQRVACCSQWVAPLATPHAATRQRQWGDLLQSEADFSGL